MSGIPRNREFARGARHSAALLIGLTLSVLCGANSAQSVPASVRAAERPAVAVPALPAGSWRFIVSGDSRNCGDIVMPAIAAHSVQFAPTFYWHLGDLRAIYKVDEDMAFAAAVDGTFLSCSLYLQRAWPDFIDHQIAAFGNVPYYVGIGNHEVITPKDRFQFRRQFAAWLDQSTLHEQRAADDPAAQKKDAPVEPEAPPTYFHWVQKKVDFIYLDNSSDCFLPAELDWLKRVLEKDASNSDPKHEVKSVVVGMHEALPDSLANSHSMGESRVQEARPSGEKAYEMLRLFRDQNHKPVYVLSSHSHYLHGKYFRYTRAEKERRAPAGMDRGHGRSRTRQASRPSFRESQARRLRLLGWYGRGRRHDPVRVSGNPGGGRAAHDAPRLSCNSGALVLCAQLPERRPRCRGNHAPLRSAPIA
jgi:hypothetical protein